MSEELYCSLFFFLQEEGLLQILEALLVKQLTQIYYYCMMMMMEILGRPG